MRAATGSRRTSRRILYAGSACAVALTAAGCGAGGGTITVGDGGLPTPAVAVAAPAPLAIDLRVGPRPVTATLRRSGYALAFQIAPNRASTSNRVSVTVTQDGLPVSGARVRFTAEMLTMDMGVASYALAGSGIYRARTPAWEMTGPWQLSFTITPPGDSPVRVDVIDRLHG